MLWLAAPLAGSLAASALLVGCAKGREAPKARGGRRPPGRPGAPQSSGGQRSSRSAPRSGSRSGRSNRRGLSQRPPASGGAAPLPLKSSSSSGRPRSASSRSAKDKKSDRSRLAAKESLKSGSAKSATKKEAKTQSSSSSRRRKSAKKSAAASTSGREKPSAEMKTAQSPTKIAKTLKTEATAKTEHVALLADKAAAKAAGDAMKDKDANARTAAPPTSGMSGFATLAPAVKHIELKIEPAELRYKSTGGLQHVSVVNTSDKRRAFKVKCSDNLLYRVNPVCAFVEPGEAARIDILRQNGAPKLDKIVVVAAEAAKEEQDARIVTARNLNNEMMVLPLIATAAE